MRGTTGTARDDGPKRVGDTLRNPELGEFMTQIAGDPASGFYHGALAERIEADMATGDGLITARDLAAYQVEVRPPLAVRFRDRTVLTNPAPAFGGALVALGLQLMGERPVESEPAAEWEAAAGCLVELEQVREAGGVHRRVRSTGGTTHVSVADEDGNVAAMTTSNGENSGYVVPGTGVMLNNMLGEDDLHPDGFHGAPPGERVSSMMSPMIVLGGGGDGAGSGNGKVEAVLGSGGSKRIRSALVQVVTGLVDDGLDARSAVERPRLHWDGEMLHLEPGFGDDVIAALAARWPINQWDEPNMYFGGPHLVRPGIDAAGDPRRGGAALTV